MPAMRLAFTAVESWVKSKAVSVSFRVSPAEREEEQILFPLPSSTETVMRPAVAVLPGL